VQTERRVNWGRTGNALPCSCDPRRSLVYALSAACALFFFFGGPDYYSARLYRVAWELGHILAFFVWTWVVLLISGWFSQRPFLQQVVVALTGALVAGLAIELTQSLVNRSFAVSDILKDILGSGAAVLFVSPNRRQLSKVSRRMLQGGVLFLMMVQALPFAEVVVDDVIARWQFPILSSFETPLEKSRWVSDSAISVDRTIVRRGNASLRIPLTAKQYSGASLQHFPSDWRNYSTLHLSIYNASTDLLYATVSVHDARHVETGREYSDRFTGAYSLEPGWTDIAIRLDRIRNAPKTRALDVGNVKDVSIYAIGLQESGIIYVDGVRLSNEL